MVPPRLLTDPPSPLPYVPAHELVVPKPYTYFDATDRVAEQFVRNDVLDLQYLQEELTFLRNHADPRAQGMAIESKVARLVLERLHVVSWLNSSVPKTATEFRALIGADLYQALNVVLHLRDEELHADQLTAQPAADTPTFTLLEQRLMRLGVSPENIDAMSAQLDALELAVARIIDPGVTHVPQELARRWRQLFLRTAHRGVVEGRTEDAIRFLARVTTVRVGQAIYRTARRFQPILTSPGSLGVDPVATPRMTEWLRTRFGQQIADGLQHYLRNDVQGTHDGAEFIQNDLQATGVYQLNLPAELTIAEGETKVFSNVFTTNVVGAQSRVRLVLELPPGAEEFVFARYDADHNRLTIKAAPNDVNHEQYVVKVRVEAEVPNVYQLRPIETPRLAVTTQVAITNANEPPRLRLAGPQHVEDGGLFCLDIAELVDPEGDPIDVHWFQEGGPTAQLVRHQGGRRICAQVAPTGQLDVPFKFSALAHDVIDPARYPGLQSRTAYASLLVYSLPTVELAKGDWVQLPPHVVELLTDPDGKDTAAVVFASSSFLYILLRLPTDLRSFVSEIHAPVANVVNVDGCEGTIPHRTWSDLTKVAGNVFAYQSRSPLRPWIRPGTYDFSRVARIALEDLRRPIWANVPVEGAADVSLGAKSLHLELGELQDDGSGTLRLPFHINNALFNGQPLLKLPEHLPVRIAVNGQSRAGAVALTQTVQAQRTTTNDRDAVYHIEIALPQEYRPQDATMTVDLLIEDIEGEVAQLRSEREMWGDGSAFDALALTMPSATIPFPWMTADLRTAPQHRTLLAQVAAGRHAFSLLPPMRLRQVSEAVALTVDPRWMRMDSSAALATLPLRIGTAYGWSVARTFIGAGGEIRGGSHFTLPKTAESDPTWNVSLQWNSEMPIEPIAGYPDGREMLRQQPAEKVAVRVERTPGGSPESPLERAYRLAFERLLEMLHSGITLKSGETAGPVTMRVVERDVHAGQVFHVDIVLPIVEGEYQLRGIVADAAPGDMLRATITDRGGRRPATYTVGATAMAKVNATTWRVTFEAPEFLPAGEYNTTVQIRRPLAANYTIYYQHPEGEKILQRTVGTTVLSTGQRALSELTIHGEQRHRNMEGRGGAVQTPGK